MQGREIWIVKLRGCDSLNESELLRGQTLLVSSTDRPELEDKDEFLVQVCHIAFLSSSFQAANKQLSYQVCYLIQAIPSSPMDQQNSELCRGEDWNCQDTSLSGPTVPFNAALLLASVSMHRRAGCELAGPNKL